MPWQKTIVASSFEFFRIGVDDKCLLYHVTGIAYNNTRYFRRTFTKLDSYSDLFGLIAVTFRKGVTP